MNIAEEHQKIANEILAVIKPDYTHDDFERMGLAALIIGWSMLKG